MRRFLSIAILLLLALPLVAPALGQGASARVLLCCRKGGAHHCMGAMPSDSPMLQARCTVCSTSSTPGNTSGWTVSVHTNTTAQNAMEELKVRQVEAGYRISFHRSRQKRGPPSVRLS